MVGASLFAKLEARCREAKPEKADKLFGNMTIVLTGRQCFCEAC